MFVAGLKNCCQCFQQRWIFAVMCFLALFNAFTMRSCLSIAITKMAVQKGQNGTESGDNDGLYEWDEGVQHSFFEAFYYGYILTHIPGGMLAERYGGKYILGIGIFLTGVFTVLSPPVISLYGSTGFVILRFLMGLGEGTTYPAINVLLAKWTPPEERSRTGSFVYAGALIGIIFATVSAGFILEHFQNSWPYVFYLLGAGGVFWFLFWVVLCYSSPQEHPFISKSEHDFLKERLQTDRVSLHHSTSIPWRHILLSVPLWASIVGLVGYNWAILTLVNDLPRYMANILHFLPQNNGIFTSSAYLSMWFGGILTSWLADYLITSKKMTTTQVRKFGSIIALTGSASVIMIVPYAGDRKYLVVALFNLALFVMGTTYPTTMINALDLSVNHAGTLMALTNGLSAITGIVSPKLMGLLAADQTLAQWKLIFWIMFGISVVTNVIFFAFSSGEVQYWDDPDFKTKRRNENSKREIETTT